MVGAEHGMPAWTSNPGHNRTGPSVGYTGGPPNSKEVRMFRWIRRWSAARDARKRAMSMPRQLVPRHDQEQAYREAFGDTFAEHEARRVLHQMSRHIGQVKPTGDIPEANEDWFKRAKLVLPPNQGLSNSVLEVYDDSTVCHQYGNNIDDTGTDSGGGGGSSSSGSDGSAPTDGS